MAAKVDIRFISDVTCPWCAVGLASLERALERLAGEVAAHVRFEPFELNPDLPPQGEDVAEYLARKYGSTPAQQAAARERLRERGAAVGFEFGERARVWNTFDAHRLLYWAGLHGGQRVLKHALLRAYHTHGRNPAAREVLLAAAADVGLDTEAAARVFDSGAFGAEVRERQHDWLRLGIQAVPSLVVNDKHLIQGGHPPESFEQALRHVAGERDDDHPA
jgi:predicted DsbA family dithiol-disulfide isomerase